jgi:hypothetical protein
MKRSHHLALAVGFALFPSIVLAPSAQAQGRSPADTKIVESYRLTMPVLRKVLPALYAPGSQRCSRDSGDPRRLSLAEITKMIDRCAPMAEALRKASVPSRDAALVLASLYRTAEAVAIRRGDVNAVDQGPLRDNALLMKENDAEIKRLTGESR